MERYMMLLKSFKRMPLELEQIIRENMRPMAVSKGEIVQKEGTVNDYLYFIEKGLFHIFADKNGEQISLRFKREDEFIIALKELFTNAAEQGDGIEALEDGLLWSFPGNLAKELKIKFHQFGIQFGVIIQKELLALDQARRCSRPGASVDNYNYLRACAPDLLDRVPSKYLANYTDMPEHVFHHLKSSEITLHMSTTRRRKR